MSGAMDVDEQNRQGRTKLHRACIAGSSQRVEELLANNATVDLEDPTGDTGLKMAAHTGAFVVMKLLIGAKADTNHQNKYGYSVLHSIAGSAKPTPKNYRTRSHAACVNVLIEAKVDVNIQDGRGNTPLSSYHNNEGSLEFSKMMIHANADVNIQNKIGRTALLSACESGSVAKARLLLEAKADVNHQDKDGWASLHWACRFGNAECVRLLIKSKADVHLQEKKGRTGLTLAAWKGQLECLKLMIDAKADVNH